MTALPAPAFDTTLADPDIPPAGPDLTLLLDIESRRGLARAGRGGRADFSIWRKMPGAPARIVAP